MHRTSVSCGGRGPFCLLMLPTLLSPHAADPLPKTYSAMPFLPTSSDTKSVAA